MHKLIEDSLLHDQIKEKIREFISYKEAFRYTFGELTITHFRIFGGKGDYIYRLAACVELLVLCGDIIDDLQDQDNTTAPWYNEPRAIVLNIAIGLLSLCNKSIVDLSFTGENRYELINTFQEYCLHSINGQHEDILNDFSTEEDYIRMARLKSGALTSIACLIGSLCAPISNYNLTLVKKYSEQIGVIAQINNDLQDLLTPTEKNDLLHLSMTLPIMYLMKKHNEASEEVIAILKKKNVNIQNQLPQIIQMIERTGAVEYTKVVQKIHKIEAFSYIDQLDVNEDSKNLIKSYII